MTSGKRLDPRSKLMIIMSLTSLGIIIQDMFTLFCILIITAIIAVMLGSSLVSAARKLRRLIMLLAVLALIQSIFAPSGNILLSFGSFTVITSGGLTRGAVLVLRMGIVLISALIITTSNSREIIQGFVQMRVPYEIAFMVSIGVRFLPLLTEEIKDILTAIQLRGVDLKKIPLKKRLKVYSYIFMPIVLGTIIKSQELSTSMEMKAFRAYPKRTSYMVLKMRMVDYAVISFNLVSGACVLYLYYMGINLGGLI